MYISISAYIAIKLRHTGPCPPFSPGQGRLCPRRGAALPWHQVSSPDLATLIQLFLYYISYAKMNSQMSAMMFIIFFFSQVSAMMFIFSEKKKSRYCHMRITNRVATRKIHWDLIGSCVASSRVDDLLLQWSILFRALLGENRTEGHKTLLVMDMPRNGCCPNINECIASCCWSY
jgi:hypothetical protein